MSAYVLECWLEAQALIAELEGMKAENADRERRGLAQAYTEKQFCEKAAALKNMAAGVHEARSMGIQ